ncbi:MAG: hypothetical protein U9Q34_02915 [Elusimicrobiota bacterium]|nr:hypothetical protein [Elusimicrobiota bacterium]
MTPASNPTTQPESDTQKTPTPQNIEGAGEINKPDIKNPTKLGEGQIKQAPLSEALMGQPSAAKDTEDKTENATKETSPDSQPKPAKQLSDQNDNSTSGEEIAFEKTLPLIYPKEDEK